MSDVRVSLSIVRLSADGSLANINGVMPVEVAAAVLRELADKLDPEKADIQDT